MLGRHPVLELLLAIAGLQGCGHSPGSGPAPSASTGVQPRETVLVFAFGSEKKTWLDEAVRDFNESARSTGTGRHIRIDGRAMGSGEAVQAIRAGTLRPHVFCPASGAYIALLNERWRSFPGHDRPIAPPGEPLALSPVVIATWKPMAEALGWPKKALGWRDFLAVNRKPAGWAAHGHPEWGSFKLGHTHPDYSNSGLLSVVAEAYAGAKKTRALTTADFEAPAARNFMATVEAAVVHYGNSTGLFFRKMIERGPAYLSAAVLYENLVVESYEKKHGPAIPMVAIYPAEGTFWSDHPYSILDAEWVGADERDASKQFLDFLRSEPAQQRALALGFRPADKNVPVGAPVDAAHGVDPTQPKTVLELPGAATLDALAIFFKQIKKRASVVLVFDKSGSMRGQPLSEAKAGANAFLDTLDDQDRVTLLFFDTKVHPEIGPYELSTHRSELAASIDAVAASGATALYDAALKARALAGAEDQSRIQAIVLMTDGYDENSRKTIGDVERAVRIEGGTSTVRVFTIAYGDDAEDLVLARIAEAGQGSTAKGDVSSIVEIYKDMASFF